MKIIGGSADPLLAIPPEEPPEEPQQDCDSTFTVGALGDGCLDLLGMLSESTKKEQPKKRTKKNKICKNTESVFVDGGDSFQVGDALLDDPALKCFLGEEDLDAFIRARDLCKEHVLGSDTCEWLQDKIPKGPCSKTTREESDLDSDDEVDLVEDNGDMSPPPSCESHANPSRSTSSSSREQATVSVSGPDSLTGETKQIEQDSWREDHFGIFLAFVSPETS